MGCRIHHLIQPPLLAVLALGVGLMAMVPAAWVPSTPALAQAGDPVTVVWNHLESNAVGAMAEDENFLYLAAYELVQKVSKSDGSVVWTFHHGIGTHAIIVDADHVYIVGDRYGSFTSTVRALSKATGELVWSFDHGASVRLLDQDETHIYIGGERGGPDGGQDLASLRRLSKATGAVDWSFDHGDAIGALLIEGDSVYIGGPPAQVTDPETSEQTAPFATVRRLNKATGTLTWSASLLGMPVNCLMVVGDHLYAGGVLTFGRVAFKLDKATGERLSDHVEGGAVRAIADDGDSLYLATGDLVRKVAKADWSVVWTFNHESPVTTLALDGDQVYIGGETGSITLRRLDRATGAVEWSVYRGPVSTLLIEGDYLYHGGTRVSRLLKADGSVDWEFIHGTEYGAPSAKIVTMAIEGDYLYIGGAGGSNPATLANVRRLDKASGALDWSFYHGLQPSNEKATVHVLRVHEDGLYIGGDMAKTYATPWASVRKLDKNTGNLIWSFNHGRSVLDLEALEDGVYIGGARGGTQEAALASVRRLARDTGALVWSFDHPVRVLDVEVAGDAVYFGGAVGACRLGRATGDLEWSFTRGSEIRTLRVDGAHLYLGGDSAGGAVARKLDNATGESLAVHLEGGSVHALAQEGEFIYLGTGNLVRKIAKADGTVAWSFRHGGMIEAISLGDDRIYISGSRTYPWPDLPRASWRRLSAVTGTEEAASDRLVIVGGLLVGDDAVYVGGTPPSLEGGLIAEKLEKATLSSLWQILFGRVARALAEDDEYVYVGAGPLVRKLRKSDGAILWTFDHGNVVSTIVAGEDGIYVAGWGSESDGQRSATVRRLSKDTGTPDWSFDHGAEIFALALDGDHVYIGGQRGGPEVGLVNGTVRRLSRDTGALDWSYDHMNLILTLAVDGDDLYIGGQPGGNPRASVRRLDKNTGEQVWAFLHDAIVRDIHADTEAVYIGGDRGGGYAGPLGNEQAPIACVRKLSKDPLDPGEDIPPLLRFPALLWSFDHGHHIWTIAGEADHLYIGGNGGGTPAVHVRRLVKATGEVDWSFSDGDPYLPVVTIELQGDRLYIGTTRMGSDVGPPLASVRGLSKATGALDWSFDHGALVSELIVDGQEIFLAGSRSSGVVARKLVVVAGDNIPPLLDPIGDKSVNEGELLSFVVSATDPDGDPLTYSASNLPVGAMFDPAIGSFSWIPAYGQAGSYPGVHFEVSDGSLTDSEDITITVSSANQPPVANAGGPYTTDLDTPVTLDGSGSSDPNEGTGDSIVLYEWIVGSGTLILSGPTPSLSAAQVNSLGVGIHPVSLTVTDSFGATDTATTTLTVNAVAPADPQEMTENLIEVVGSLDLPEEIQNSLTSKLSNVIKSLEKGQSNAAINQLNAFINEVQAQSGKKLTSEQASMLILEATRIIERCRAI